MIVGTPNAGKSMIAMFMCLRWAQAGEHVLYFSADSNAITQTTRLAAMLTGHKTRDIRYSIFNGGLAYYEEILGDLDLRFDFNSNPTLDDIDLTIAAYDELYGRYPTVIVADNLINVSGMGGEEGEKKALIGIQQTFKYICRETNAAIIILHHCSEASAKPGKPPPMSAIQQKVSELPEVELSVAYNTETSEYGVAAVKNRHGRADPGANNPVWLFADMDSGRFWDSKFEAIQAGIRV